MHPARSQGIHYTERGRPPPPLPRRGTLSQSTGFHTLADLDQDWGPGLSYCFLSPVFDSISKQGYAAGSFDQERLSSALARPARPPVIALGGITPDRVPQVHAMGLDGVAVIGAVWQADNPLAACQALQRACEAAWPQPLQLF